MSANTGPIETAVTAWVTAWSELDSKKLLNLWDNTDDQATYLPAERVDPLIGNSSVSGYVNSLCTHFDQVRHRAEDAVYRRLSEDTGLAFYTLAWMFSDARGPIGGTCRVTAVWRQHGNLWRLFHYAEAPLAPLLELKNFYESVASEGLDAIPVRAQP
ncbi:MAG: SnoaL-like domain-containing protein [Rhodospirillaceae bacterium]|nr:SnoaL-like domain-containing protein [Rhodospirillaceae bacterium]MBT5240119.1 SnoaL-like domain-containing protein [Rhodospirillaceae bacterium]MBT5566898.1 SnoaL-like domain-containing protein [Rhodospirillaceae bacterium]MBT6090415.1 SnoaL-like domain-containing protein [Rhodospirillaceae bacterium]MBT7450703.1 SnoaL-like domain-containing protein [Rhodospirillaceae bacterium]